MFAGRACRGIWAGEQVTGVRSVDRNVGVGLERTDVFVRPERSRQEFGLASRGSFGQFRVIASETDGSPSPITYAKTYFRKLFCAVSADSDALFQ